MRPLALEEYKGNSKKNVLPLFLPSEKKFKLPYRIIDHGESVDMIWATTTTTTATTTNIV
jgi:hypothetical protein